MRTLHEQDKPFPCGDSAIEKLFTELMGATKQRNIDPYSSNILGALLIDIASGRGLSRLSKYLSDQILREPYFHAEGMMCLTELPQGVTCDRLEDEFWLNWSPFNDSEGSVASCLWICRRSINLTILRSNVL